MRRVLQIVGTVAAGLLLLAVMTVGALIGLNAECNGAADECPRSGAYRATLIAGPVAALVLLLGGAAWAVRRRELRPLLLGEAGVVVFALAVDPLLRHLAG